MVALIHHEMAVVADSIVHHAFANQTLDDCHVQRTRRVLSAAADPADGIGRQSQECR